jgi:hypothetical protein
MNDIDDLLDDRMSGTTGDYPPWFDEEGTELGEPPITDEGSVLQGRVTKIRDDPFYDPSEENEPKPILHVEQDSGDEWSTRTHVTLVQLIREQDPEVGDLIRIQYDGSFKTDNGQMANDYQLGVVRSEELEDVEQEAASDGGTTTETSGASTPEDGGTDVDMSEQTVSDIEALVSTIDDVDKLNQMAAAEMAGKDRKTAKAQIQNRLDELGETDEPEDDSGGTDDDDPEVPGDVTEFTESLMSFHGELTFDELDEYLNDTRDFDIKPSVVAEALDDVEVDDNVVRQA